MAEERVQRRLAAIMVADVVGYSRMMGAAEESTLAALTAHLTEFIEPCIADHRGRIVKTTGDGLLVEFASVVDAVRCAVAFQDGMAARSSAIPKNERIEFRIGINLGDIIIQDDDVFGDGVNIAARLEGLAEAGAVVVSSSVREQVVTKVEVGFDDLGPQQVKNIGEPVRAFCIRTNVAKLVQPDKPVSPALPDKPSIAVLPFDNISNDPDQEYFSDGITEDIITELSKISGLFVIARHSTFTYKGKSVTLKQIGRDLGVQYVLEGSVRKAGNRLRITAQLIDANTDHHLWANRFDRNLEDIFALQDEVARRVAQALEVTLKPDEHTRLIQAPPHDVEAYDLYLRIRMTFWPPTATHILTARNAYAQVIEAAPGFAGGYAGKSITHAMAVLFNHSERSDQDAADALALAGRAVENDPEFALGHSALGFANAALGRPDEAVAAARHAVSLQPSDADTHVFLAQCFNWAGRGDEASEIIKTAMRLDPQFTTGPHMNALGRACFISGRYAEAVEAYEQNSRRGGPIALPMLTAWIASYSALGRAEEAKATARRLLEIKPNFSISRDARKMVWSANTVELDRLIDGLREAGVPE